MDVHKNARLTPRGRALLVERVRKEGARRAAEAFGLSQKTARKWAARFAAEGLSGLEDRSSRPARSPRALPAGWVDLIRQLRRATRLTGAQIGERLSLARSTVAAYLTRLGLGRLKALEPKEPVRRYQRELCGELLHLDVKKLGRFDRTGHRITSSRLGRSKGAGWDFVHVAPEPSSAALAPAAARWIVPFFYETSIRGAVLHVRSCHLWVNLFADIFPTALDYGIEDAAGNFQPVFSPWRVRPGAALEAVFP